VQGRGEACKVLSLGCKVGRGKVAQSQQGSMKLGVGRVQSSAKSAGHEVGRKFGRVRAVSHHFV
jgi:hypothetical protein